MSDSDKQRMTCIGQVGGLMRPDNGEVAAAKALAVEAYRLTGTRSRAARAAGVTRRTIGRWIEEDPSSRRPSRERALGREQALHYQGRVTGDTVKQYSDLLMIFLLKSLRPNIYRDNAKVEVEHTRAPDMAAARDRFSPRSRPSRRSAPSPRRTRSRARPSSSTSRPSRPAASKGSRKGTRGPGATEPIS